MIETLVPLFAITFAIGLPLAIPIVIIVLNYRKRRQLMELHHIERMAAIERGMEIPPLPMELIDGSARQRHTSLLPGLVWLFVGLAILIALDSVSSDEAMIGLIPTGVGLAYLIYYFIDGRKIETRLLQQQEAREAQERTAGARPR